MNTVKLRTLTPGGSFCIADHEFVILEHYPKGGTLVLDCQNERALPFNDKDVEDWNDFRSSSIKEYLNGEYLEDLLNGGGIDAADMAAAILDLTIDLKATDGTRAYGYDTVKVGLLTLEQYGKYKDIIPLNENDCWWLASPWATRWLRSPSTSNTYYAWYVLTSGSFSSCNDVTNSYGVRPALRLDSDLLVSTDDPEFCHSDKEIETWTTYLRYIATWAIDHSGLGFFGMAPASYDEWLSEEYEKEGDDDE